MTLEGTIKGVCERETEVYNLMQKVRFPVCPVINFRAKNICRLVGETNCFVSLRK